MNEAIELAINVLIKPFEGYARKMPDGGCCAYPDPATGGDPWTIGYGSTGSDIRQHTVWTKEQAEDALQAHVRYFVSGLVKLSPRLLSASPRRIAAVISWAYNLGLGNYRIGTFKRRIDASDWSGAAEQVFELLDMVSGHILGDFLRQFFR